MSSYRPSSWYEPDDDYGFEVRLECQYCGREWIAEDPIEGWNECPFCAKALERLYALPEDLDVDEEVADLIAHGGALWGPPENPAWDDCDE